MRYVDDFKGPVKKGVGAAYATIARFPVAGLDVLMLDIENVGASPLAGFKVFARVSGSAPLRDVTPSSWTAESELIWKPTTRSLSTLSAGQFAQVGLNVAAYEAIELQAVGDGAVLGIAAGGFEVSS
ncbi:hypothetical protein [Methyloversatilis discipulorum]|uniref:hypothetical protein n=1 Tax=Methyloversatilis discipulorum TaxID=1119528 RepID=UPI001A52EF42|nr:hypothetical protein [Methyloversatilis discipulorum]MBL8467372.1 hypothetical protein [Methyloversatilis discipulorum]